MDDLNRITNFTTTLREWEGVELKLGELEVKITVVPLHGRGRTRLYFDAPRCVAIKRFDAEEPDGGPDAA